MRTVHTNIIYRMFSLGICMVLLFQLKASNNENESTESIKVKDEKFLEGLASDKQYLEHIIKQLSTTNLRNNPNNPTTKSVLSEVIN